MLYEPKQIEISENHLEKIFRQLKGDFCLIGGWATYQIVNKNFEESNGRKYIGSKDIDIGFHIDERWSEEQLKTSEFYNMINILEKKGFISVGFRLVKNFDFETGIELTVDEAATRPLHEVFQLYVDPIVDHIHPKIKDILGFIPIDEPLLAYVFKKNLCTQVKMYGSRVLLPEPHVLLAMKLNAAPKRDKEYKKIKDIADIFALLWFSDIRIDRIKANLLSIYPEDKVRKTVDGFTRDEVGRASEAIGMRSAEVRRVLAELS